MNPPLTLSLLYINHSVLPQALLEVTEILSLTSASTKPNPQFGMLSIITHFHPMGAFSGRIGLPPAMVGPSVSE